MSLENKIKKKKKISMENKALVECRNNNDDDFISTANPDLFKIMFLLFFFF
jgi:hypothetical protein